MATSDSKKIATLCGRKDTLLWHRLMVVLLIAGLLSGCARLFMHPMKPHVWDPAQAGIVYNSIYFHSADGTRLHGWLLPSRQPGEARASVLFLHGNAENISTHIASVWWLPHYGFNVFLFDYRGFGRSEGEPELNGALADADAALAKLASLPEVDPDRVILFGQSLGASLALTLAAKTDNRQAIRGVVAEGAFSSYRAIAREKLAELWLTWPLQWLPWLTLSDELAPIRHVADIAPTPLLLIAGQNDTIVLPHHSERLHAAAGSPRELWLVPEAGHIGVMLHEDQRRNLVRKLCRWLDERDCAVGAE